MKYLSKICLTALLLTFISCSSPVRDAQTVTTQFYYNVMRQNFKGIIPYLDKKMLRNVPAEYWIKTLDSLQKQRGATNKYSIKKVEVFKDNQAHLLVQFTLKVVYERNTYIEQLLLIQRRKNLPFTIIKYSYKTKMK